MWWKTYEDGLYLEPGVARNSNYRRCSRQHLVRTKLVFQLQKVSAFVHFSRSKQRAQHIITVINNVKLLNNEFNKSLHACDQYSVFLLSISDSLLYTCMFLIFSIWICSKYNNNCHIHVQAFLLSTVLSVYYVLISGHLMFIHYTRRPPTIDKTCGVPGT